HGEHVERGEDAVLIKQQEAEHEHPTRQQVPHVEGKRRGHDAFPGCGAAWSEAERCAADPGSTLAAPGPRVCSAALRFAACRAAPGESPALREWGEGNPTTVPLNGSMEPARRIAKTPSRQRGGTPPVPQPRRLRRGTPGNGTRA